MLSKYEECSQPPRNEPVCVCDVEAIINALKAKIDDKECVIDASGEGEADNIVNANLVEKSGSANCKNTNIRTSDNCKSNCKVSAKFKCNKTDFVRRDKVTKKKETIVVILWTLVSFTKTPCEEEAVSLEILQ